MINNNSLAKDSPQVMHLTLDLDMWGGGGDEVRGINIACVVLSMHVVHS